MNSIRRRYGQLSNLICYINNKADYIKIWDVLLEYEDAETCTRISNWDRDPYYIVLSGRRYILDEIHKELLKEFHFPDFQIYVIDQ